MPFGDHQVEPLAIMYDVALVEVLPYDLRSDLAEALASQLIVEFCDRKLVLDPEQLSDLSDCAGEPVGLASRLVRQRYVLLLVSQAGLVPAQKPITLERSRLLELIRQCWARSHEQER